MRRLVLIAVSLALAVAAVAATDAPSDPVVVGTDTCTVGVDLEEGTSPDAEDLCSLTFQVLSDGDPTTGDEPVSIAVELRAAGPVEDRLGSVLYGVQWEAGGCEIDLLHRTASVVDPGGDRLVASCDGVVYECDTDPTGTTRSDCEVVEGTVEGFAIAPPVFDGDTVTWVLTFDGDLEALAERHPFGGEIDPVVGFSAHEADLKLVTPTSTLPDPRVSTSPTSFGVCGLFTGGFRDCTSALGDIVFTPTAVVVPID